VVVLDRPRILTIVGQLVPAAMPQDMAGDEEREFKRPPRPAPPALVAGHTQRGEAFGYEDMDRPLATSSFIRSRTRTH
jgi:hypothetical protein